MRSYSFELPLQVPWITGHLEQLKDLIVANDLWPEKTTKDKIPPKLAIRIRDALAEKHGITITQEDLDSIPDPVWLKVDALITKMRK